MRVERREAAGWAPVTTYGRTCDDTGHAFVTDAQGGFQRGVPAVPGPADYRFSWRRSDGSWEASNPVAVAP